MVSKEKRILWLLNHTTLREFEVPLLRSLGFEVYTSKLGVHDKGFRNGSADYSLDDHLTIPREAIQCLNEYNFYVSEMPWQVKQIINTYFDTTIIAAYTKLFTNLTTHFDGQLLIRAFGQLAPMTYAEAFSSSLNHQFETFVKSAREKKIWLAYAYKSIIGDEPAYLKNASVYLPLGVPEHFFKNTDNWTGESRKIFFVCPNILDLEYYENIYKNFKKNFGDLPHLIGGTQVAEVNDPLVLGKVSREEFDQYLKTSRLMFYHSEEPKHLHYHPVEAMIFGMPVVFMAKGVLGSFDNTKNQPGACRTVREARNKIKRILNDDWDFIRSIQSAQKKLIEPFTEAYNKEIWQKNLVQGILKTSVAKPLLKKPKPKRVAVFLARSFYGDSLNAAKAIAKMLLLGSRERGRPVEVVFSCLDNTYDLQKEFSDLIEMGIGIRETTWKVVSGQAVQDIIFANVGCETRAAFFKPLAHSEYILPCDKMSNFADCDLWLIVSDGAVKPIAPIKSLGIVVYDYIQRYNRDCHLDLQALNSHFVEHARMAHFVLTTTPQTREDCIQYAGVAANKVFLTPMNFDPAIDGEVLECREDNYFIWPTHLGAHNNHQVAIEALCYYYEKLQGKLNVIITGNETENFNFKKSATLDSPYIHEVRALLERNKSILKNRLKIASRLSQYQYISTLATAKFLWNPSKVDHVNFATVEAAYYGIPSLSSDYPQMQYLNNYFNLNLKFSGSDNFKQIAEKLKAMELGHSDQAKLLPSKEFLKQFSYQKCAGSFYETIENFL